MRWYAILFWIWLVVSLVILVLRRTGGARGRDATEPAAVADPLSRSWAPPPADPDAPLDPPSDGRAGVAGLDDTTATAPPSHPADDASVPSSPAPSGPATLPDLLAGIALPHDLVPLTQHGVTDMSRHLVLATDRAGADVVREGLVDELRRLGYDVVPTGPLDVVAEGPRGRIAAEIHPSAAAVVDGGTPRFPTALPGTVVVELRAG